MSELTTMTKKIQKIATIIFIAVVLWMIPLYHQGMFNQITEAKFTLYRNTSLITFAILIAATLTQITIAIITNIKTKQPINLKNQLSKISITDWLVLTYIITAIIAYLIQDWQINTILWGYPARRMGLMSQIFFALTYYYVSRHFTPLKAAFNATKSEPPKITNQYTPQATILCAGMMLVAFTVMLLGLLHRFWLDPTGILEGIHPGWVFNALSTIGNPNRYSGYIALMLPFGLFFYWQTKNKIIRITAGIYTAIAAATGVTQNSESYFFALFFILLTFFHFSFKTNDKMKRLLEIIIITLASFVIIGIIQTQVYIEMTLQIKALSLFISQSIWTKIALGITIALYITFYRLDKKGKININKWKKLRNSIHIATLTGIMLIITYIILNTKEILPETLRTGGFLLFDNEWGSHRGFIWRIAIATFAELPPLQQVFGAGSEGFYPASVAYFSEELYAQFQGKSAVIEPHNEWLGALVNSGIIGAAAYIGIFITAIKRYTAKITTHPILLPITATTAGYIAHNIFTYQTVTATPALFIFIATAEAIIRRNENGSEQQPPNIYRVGTISSQ